jgi:hemerythrin-like domain-containing protein
MKRHPTLIPLSREHHQGLLLAQLMKLGAPAYRGMPQNSSDKIAYAKAKFESLLKGHFEQEEEKLFPFLLDKAPLLSGLITELKNEHQQMTQMVQELHASAPNEAKMDAFGKLLESHIRKEERVLFEDAQRELEESDWKELALQLHN